MDQAISQASPKRPYVAPPISLLNPPAPEIDQNEDYEQKKEQIINTLAFFSITGEVIDIMVGPTFTMYKLIRKRSEKKRAPHDDILKRHGNPLKSP
jgi:DNA segregation ATPase FtsK/SpoIIIE-like protein